MIRSAMIVLAALAGLASANPAFARERDRKPAPSLCEPSPPTASTSTSRERGGGFQMFGFGVEGSGGRAISRIDAIIAAEGLEGWALMTLITRKCRELEARFPGNLPRQNEELERFVMRMIRERSSAGVAEGFDPQRIDIGSGAAETPPRAAGDLAAAQPRNVTLTGIFSAAPPPSPPQRQAPPPSTVPTPQSFSTIFTPRPQTNRPRPVQTPNRTTCFGNACPGKVDYSANTTQGRTQTAARSATTIIMNRAPTTTTSTCTVSSPIITTTMVPFRMGGRMVVGAIPMPSQRTTVC